MKKNILKIAFVVALAMVSGINVFNAQKSNVLSDIALANVEALANDESSLNADCIIYCQSDSRYTCYISWGEGIEGVTCPEHRKK